MQRSDSPVAGDEFQQALATVRSAKNVFWWLILLALLVQLTAFVLVQFGGVIRGSTAMPEVAAPATVPAEKATTQLAPITDESAETWRLALGWLLPAGKFVALASVLLLVLTLMFAVKLALQAQTGGVAGLIGAFFWSLLLLVVLIPWQQALPASTVLAGATHNLGDLVTASKQADDAGVMTVLLFYGRFLAYPVLALLLLWIVAAKWGRGYRAARGIEVATVSAGATDDRI